MTVRRILYRFLAVICLVIPSQPSLAETFILLDGNVVRATAVRSVDNIIPIKLEGTGIERLRLDEIQQVELSAFDGRKIAGRLLDWPKGVYQVMTDQGPMFANHLADA